jgi:hypothetical protein
MRHLGLRNACLIVAGCIAVLSLAAQSMGRQWSFGKFKFEAEVESYDGKDVYLKMSNNKARKLPITKLSEEDRAYLKTTYPDGKARATKDKAGPAKSSPDQVGAGKPAASKAPATKPAAATAPDAKASDVSVELVSLTLTKPSAASAGLVPGTHATLLVSSPSKTLLRVDAEKTKIVCADDRATNLSKPSPDTKPSTEESKASTEESKAAKEESGLTLDVAPDGKTGTIVFNFPRAPSPKATRIRLKGELHLVCGSDQAPEPVTVPLTIIVSLGL